MANNLPLAFGQPAALLLLLALPVLVLVAQRRLSALGRLRASAALAVRLAVVASLALALADPRILVPDRRLSVVFATQGSASVSAEQQASAREWIASALSSADTDDHAAVLAFGRQPAVLTYNARRTTEPTQTVDPSATNVAAALRMAGELASAAPGERRIVLLSDGWETTDDAEALVGWLTSLGISVSFVPLTASASGPEVAVQRIDVPGTLRDGETTDIAVALASNVDTDALLSLSVDGQDVLKRIVQVHAGSNRVLLPYTAESQQRHSLSVAIEPAVDTLDDNNRADSAIVVKPRARVLLVQQRSDDADAFAAALSNARLEVDRRGPDAIPARAADLTAYDAVVLVNVQATVLSLDQQLTLQSFARDLGRGVMVVGGAASLGLGGYADTELEKMLPVLASPPDRRDQGDVALVLVIDSSGSMSLASNHVSKLAMAKEAAIQAASVLKSSDSVGILAFSTTPQWIVTPQMVAANGGLEAIQTRLATMKAAGGTDIYTALDTALQAAAQLPSQFRHVLLVTDGQSPNPNYVGLVDHFQALGVTLSTVGIGGDADTALLLQLAQHGKGRSYFTQRLDDIPSIVAKETTVATRSALAEGQFRPSSGDPSPMLNELDGVELPELHGYVRTTARPGATVPMLSPRQDPIMASWHFGLGRVVIWTSDAGASWAHGWFDTPALADFFPRAVRWSMAAPVDPALSSTVEVAGSRVTITAESLEPSGTFVNGLDTRAVVLTPELQALQLPLVQVAPGRYQRQFTVDQSGTYGVVVRQIRPSGETLNDMLGFVVDGNLEHRAIGTNESLLRSLAAHTGGRLLQSPADAFTRDDARRSDRWWPVWSWLLTTALLLFPLDVALRRLHLPRRGPFARSAPPAPERPER